MGREDIKRQQLNVFRMELLGAKVEAVDEVKELYLTQLIKRYSIG